MQIRNFLTESFIDYPGKVASVVFTPKCNYKCPACHAKHLLEDRENIQEKDFFEDLDSRKNWIEGVVLCGGEPTLHPYLLDIIPEVSQRAGIVLIATNGACIRTEQQVSRFADLLTEFPNLQVVFAADNQHEEGLPDFHTRLRYLLSLGDTPQIQFRVTELTYEKALETIVRLALPKDRSRIAHLHTNLTFAGVNTKPTLFVCEDGLVYGRESDLLRRRPPLGSVLERPLKEIVAATYR